MHKNPLTAVSGIYTITNLKTTEKYVGSAVCFASRFRRHRHDLKHGRHHSIYLQRSWNKHGEDNFEFSVLELTSKDKNDLISKEQFWINSINPVYNMSKKAGRSTLPEWFKEKRSNELAKDYIVTDPQGKQIEVRNLKKFCIENGLDFAQMHQVARGKTGQHKGWKASRKNNPFPLYKYRSRLIRVLKKDGVIYEFDDVEKFSKEHLISTVSLFKLFRGAALEIKGFSLVSNGH